MFNVLKRRFSFNVKLTVVFISNHGFFSGKNMNFYKLSVNYFQYLLTLSRDDMYILNAGGVLMVTRE